MENTLLGFLWPKRRTQTPFTDLLKLGKLFLIAHNCPRSKFLKHKRLLGSVNIVRYARTLAVLQVVANARLNICSHFTLLYYHSCYSMIGTCCCFVYCFFVFSQGHNCVPLIIWKIIFPLETQLEMICWCLEHSTDSNLVFMSQDLASS